MEAVSHSLFTSSTKSAPSDVFVGYAALWAGGSAGAKLRPAEASLKAKCHAPHRLSARPSARGVGAFGRARKARGARHRHGRVSASLVPQQSRASASIPSSSTSTPRTWCGRRRGSAEIVVELLQAIGRLLAPWWRLHDNDGRDLSPLLQRPCDAEADARSPRSRRGAALPGSASSTPYASGETLARRVGGLRARRGVHQLPAGRHSLEIRPVP
jgi:hypothetical protein